MAELAVFVFCMIGCGLSCHAIGKQQGIAATVEHLVDTGMIKIDDE